MTGLADPLRSRAVLIGVAAYRHMEAVPAVTANVSELKRILCDPQVWGLPADYCRVVSDPASSDEIFQALREAADHAEEALVVYYAGHGLKDRDKGGLHLTHTGSDAGRPWTTIDYLELRRVIKDTMAGQRVIVLDCCYSGLAGTLADPATDLRNMLPSRYDTIGTYLLAATGKTLLASAPAGDRFTAFTAELLQVLEHGISGRGPLLDMQTIYRQLLNTMRQRNLPEPEPYTQGDATAIALVRNRAYREDAGGTHASATIAEHLPLDAPATSKPAQKPAASTARRLTHILTLKPPSGSSAAIFPLHAVDLGQGSPGRNMRSDLELVAAAGQEGRAFMWNCTTGELLRSARLSGPANALAFGMHGRFYCAGAALSVDQLRIGIPDVPDVLSFFKPGYQVSAMSFISGYSHEKVVTAGDSGLIQTWVLENSYPRYEAHLTRTWTSHDGSVYDIVTVGDDVVASVGSGNTACVWSALDGELKQSFDGSVGTLHAVAATRHLIAAAGDTGLVWVWDIGTGDHRGVFGDRSAPIRALAIRNGQLAAGDDDGRITLWDLDSGDLISTGHGHQASVLALKLRLDTLASASADGTVRLWRMPKYEPPGTQVNVSQRRKGFLRRRSKY
jgi:Caspase domain